MQRSMQGSFVRAAALAAGVLGIVTAGLLQAAPPTNQPNITWASNGAPPGWGSLGWWIGTWSPAAAGIGVTNTVQGGVTYGWLDVVSATDVANAGTINLNFPGYTADNRDRMTFTVNGGAGTLTNTGTMNLNANGAYGGPLYLYGNVLNDAAGVLTIASGSSGGGAVFGTVGAAHENRNAWTASGTSGSGGLALPGNGTSFTQSAVGASLSLYRFNMGSDADTSQGVFSVTGGSLAGAFTFQRAAVTLGAGATVSAPTTFTFLRDNVAGSDAGKPINSFTGNVPANLTLVIKEAGGGSSGGFLDTPGSFSSAGTITLNQNGGYVDNGAYPRLRVLNDGTLTNTGTMNFQVGTPYSGGGQSYTVFEGHLTNEASGVLNLSTISNANGGGSKTVRFTKAGGTYVNRGLATLSQATTNPFLRWELTGGTVTNDTGGVIRGNGTTVASTSTILGTATLDNANGTIEVAGSSGTYTLTVSNALAANTKSGANTLLAGGYSVTGGSAATALSLSAFTSITTLGAASGPAATVTLDGANAAFTQLESGNPLATINATGRLNILGGKSFTSAAALANAGTIQVGAGSTLSVGAGGTGTLTQSGAGALAGTGTVLADVTVAGGTHVAPGSSPGTLTLNGDIVFADGAVYDWELGGATGDVINVSAGTLDFGGTMNLTIDRWNGSQPYIGQDYLLLSYSGATLLNAPSGWSISYLDPYVYGASVVHDAGNSRFLLTGLLPEPGAATLLALAAAAGLLRRRTR